MKDLVTRSRSGDGLLLAILLVLILVTGPRLAVYYEAKNPWAVGSTAAISHTTPAALPRSSEQRARP